MRTSRWASAAVLFFLLLVALAGCTESTVYVLDCSLGAVDVSQDTPPPPDIPPADIPLADAGEDVVSLEKVVGAPCGADGDCPTDLCLTTDSLQNDLGLSIAMADGMCSRLYCLQDSDCGGEAACVDGGGFAYCASACDDYIACRYAQGYRCAPALDGATPGCVAVDYLVRARCGDGVCDESEKAVADQCPRDCPTPPAVPLPSGAPCATDADCVAGFCLTKEFLASFGLEVELPNNVCSSHPFESPCTDDAVCGDGGICADATALAGLPLKLCLHSCETDGDCRYREGYVCFATDEAAGDAGQKACLPDAVVVSIRCADGVCDDTERIQPDLCPEEVCE